MLGASRLGPCLARRVPRQRSKLMFTSTQSIIHLGHGSSPLAPAAGQVESVAASALASAAARHGFAPARAIASVVGHIASAQLVFERDGRVDCCFLNDAVPLPPTLSLSCAAESLESLTSLSRTSAHPDGRPPTSSLLRALSTSSTRSRTQTYAGRRVATRARDLLPPRMPARFDVARNVGRRSRLHRRATRHRRAPRGGAPYRLLVVRAEESSPQSQLHLAVSWLPRDENAWAD